jgi:C1A family cysteine protease
MNSSKYVFPSFKYLQALLEMTYQLNYHFENEDERDHVFRLAARQLVDLPKSVDMSEDFGEIFDQGDLGSCVANTVSYCIRYVRQRDNMSPLFDPSRLYIYYYGRVVGKLPHDQDLGLFIREGMKSVCSYSVCSEDTYPYNLDDKDLWKEEPHEEARDEASTFETFEYIRVEKELTALKAVLADGYPISFGFIVWSGFMSKQVSETGIAWNPRENERRQGGHAMTLVGYDDETRRFKCANSWGEHWGDGGYCTFPFSFITGRWCSDFWTVRAFH